MLRLLSQAPNDWLDRSRVKKRRCRVLCGTFLFLEVTSALVLGEWVGTSGNATRSRRRAAVPLKTTEPVAVSANKNWRAAKLDSDWWIRYIVVQSSSPSTLHAPRSKSHSLLLFIETRSHRKPPRHTCEIIALVFHIIFQGVLSIISSY